MLSLPKAKSTVTTFKGGTTKWFRFYYNKWLDDYKYAKKYMQKPVFHWAIGKWNIVPGGAMWLGNVSKVFNLSAWGIGWKDKWNTPRFERPATLHITIFRKWAFSIWYQCPREIYKSHDYDRYWEQYLWIRYYCNNDVQKAINEWPWTTWEDNPEDVKTTWRSEYLNDKYKDIKRTIPVEVQGC